MSVATSTAIALGVAAGTAGSGIYGAHRAGSTNDKALALDERDSVRQEKLAREAMAADQARWKDYLRVHEPIWAGAGNTLRSLYDLAGVSGAPSGSVPTPTLSPGDGGGDLAVPPRGPIAGQPPGARPRGSRLRAQQPGIAPMSLADLLNLAAMAGPGPAMTAPGSGNPGRL